MTEIIKYVADDGTEFEDEWDCRLYEWQQDLGDPKFFLLNDKRKLLDPKDSKSYEDAYFLFIPDNSALRQLRNIWNDDFIDALCPNFLYEDDAPCGLWAYDEDINRNDGWYHMGKFIEEKTKLANECLAIINGGV